MPGPFNVALANTFNAFFGRIFNVGDPTTIVSARSLKNDIAALPDIGIPSNVVTQFGGPSAVDTDSLVRIISQNDQPAIDGMTTSPELQFLTENGESWVIDATLVFTGKGGYTDGLNVAVDHSGGAPNGTQETASGPDTSNDTCAFAPNMVAGNASGPFARFSLKPDEDNATIHLHGSYRVTSAGVLAVQFQPFTGLADLITLRAGSTLVAYRVS